MGSEQNIRESYRNHNFLLGKPLPLLGQAQRSRAQWQLSQLIPTPTDAFYRTSTPTPMRNIFQNSLKTFERMQNIPPQQVVSVW